jgi:hypothetical protein
LGDPAQKKKFEILQGEFQKILFKVEMDAQSIELILTGDPDYFPGGLC